MSAEKLIEEYKALVASFLRNREMHRAGGNEQKREQIQALSDDDLVNKWLWIGSIAGGFLCFFVLPFLFFMLDKVIPHWLMEPLWIVLKLAMGIVLIMLCLAICMTTRKSNN